MRHAASDSRSVGVITSPSAAIAVVALLLGRIVETVDLEHHERDRLQRPPRRGDALLDEHLVVLLTEQSGHGVHDGLRLGLGERQDVWARLVLASSAKIAARASSSRRSPSRSPTSSCVLVLDAAEPGADRRRADRGEEPEAARDEAEVGLVGDAATMPAMSAANPAAME